MKGSYQFEKLEGRKDEATFLAERAKMRLSDFPSLLLKHGASNNGTMLEVGCGQGIRTQIISQTFPLAKVIGIDRSQELLAQALDKQTNNLSFLEADLYHLPFSDESFDFIYARLVFMHLNNPMDALSSLFRVLKKGGKILIEDADRDCMFFEPAPKSFAPFWKKVQAGQRRLGGDPNVGRKLAPYLKELGLKNVMVDALPILGGGSDIDFLARTLLPSLNIYLIPEDRKQGESAIQDLKELARNPFAMFYHFWFAVSGEKNVEY
jgi:SAM-dependent methyltransferase